MKEKRLKSNGNQNIFCKLYADTRDFFGIGIVDQHERKAIEEHKYYLSEKAGRDVGWKYAYDDWVKNYSKKWKEEKLKKER